jgi:hypothetical protein
MDDRVWDFIDNALANAGDISGLDPVLESYGLRMVRVFDTNDDAFIELHDCETNASVAALTLSWFGHPSRPDIRAYGPAVSRPWGR